MIIMLNSGENVRLRSSYLLKPSIFGLAGETLAGAQMKRHDQVTITVDSARLADKKLYGAFHSDEPEGFARAAAATLGVHVDTRQNRIELHE